MSIVALSKSLSKAGTVTRSRKQVCSIAWCRDWRENESAPVARSESDLDEKQPDGIVADFKQEQEGLGHPAQEGGTVQ